jgi:hypothetical protein
VVFISYLAFEPIKTIMFNYVAIDKTPTVYQVKAIIEYLEQHSPTKDGFSSMMDMDRVEKNVILLDLNNGHFGTTFEVVFNDSNDIESFDITGNWIS